MMLESKYITNHLKPRFLKMGCKFKRHPQNIYSAGWPDVEVRWKGLTINIEVKIDDRVVTRLQKAELISIAAHGGISIVIRREDGIEYISGINVLSQSIAFDIGREFEKLSPKAKIVYSYKESTFIKMEVQRITGGSK